MILEDALYLKTNNCKGSSEMFAINYAYLHSNLIRSSIFIIKITARFFIPELESYLSLFTLNDYDCLTQENRDRCEMVGCHFNHFSDIFNIHFVDNNYYVEAVWKFRTSNYKKVLVCKTFTIEETQRGGVDEKYTTI